MGLRALWMGCLGERGRRRSFEGCLRVGEGGVGIDGVELVPLLISEM
jgi:hypothetical protein